MGRSGSPSGPSVPATPEHLWLMVFEELPAATRVTGRRTGGAPPALVRQLEAEIRATRKQQQLLVEQLESGNQELKAANEEILSMNEELQSSNEELVTSKEELQSTNEELTTLNAQLQEKVQELTVVNDDLANLLVGTDIVTVFLDADLCIKRFTTVATRLFNLLPSDVGRPITHITTSLMDVDLPADARAVMETLVPIEREATGRFGGKYLLRLFPYRTADRAVNGVVLTLVDVTALKATEQELRVTKEQEAADLQRMSRLHGVSTRLAGTENVQPLLEEILGAAIEITGADMGNIQTLEEPGRLTIAAHVGFKQPLLDYFARATTDTDSAGSAALANRRRVMVEDVNSSPIFSGKASLDALLAAGVRAVQSTPLFDRSGELVGMFSTHFRTQHQFSESEERWLDLLGRQAADLIVRRNAGRAPDVADEGTGAARRRSDEVAHPRARGDAGDQRGRKLGRRLATRRSPDL